MVDGSTTAPACVIQPEVGRGDALCAAEQSFAESQLSAHFARHSMRRPHEAQVLSALSRAGSDSADLR